MAVSTSNAISGPYTTNGATVEFPFTFTAPSTAEVTVLLRDSAGGETYPDGYTVALTAGGGGSVTFGVAPAAGYALYALLDPKFTQDITFEDGSAWSAAPVNEGYDRSAARDQVLKFENERSIKAPIGEYPAELPASAGRANRLTIFDNSGNFGVLGGSQGLVMLDSQQHPSTVPVFDILSSIGTTIHDDGAWGGAFGEDDGVWG